MTQTETLVEREARALEALLDYGQADEDGVMVITSRQAIHEVSDTVTRLQAELDEAVAIIDWLNRKGGLGLDVHDRLRAFITKHGEKS